MFAVCISYYDRDVNGVLALAGYLSLALVSWYGALYVSRWNRQIGAAFLCLGVLYIFLSNSALLGLLVFSGQGFTNEVFYHFEPVAFKVAWDEYATAIVIGASLLAVVLGALIGTFVRSAPGKAFSLRDKWLQAASLAVLVFTLGQTPAYGLVSAYIEYRSYESETTVFTFADYLPFQKAGILNSTEVLKKSDLAVTPPPQPKNLLLIYLESFNHGLSEHPDYPGLTPEINALQAAYPSTSNHYNSAFVTIEGIVSSQCGTLLPMTRAANSIMGENSAMPTMACLGDILAEAGYTQYYLGGAPMEFAGKGQFLQSHGYQDIRGWEHWAELGRKQRTGVWGLSDPELFEEAIATVEKAVLDPPYNLTLLTLGTHLPGFLYEECQPYAADAAPFINAAHCTDQLLGKFISTLEERKLLENTLVFIVGDHGVFPTIEMRKLFGDMVEDRRILTLAWPAPALPENWPMATYDVAPTLLDLLDIGHNQQFLYGDSALAKPESRFFVTRYYDWVDGKRANASEGSCGQPLAGPSSPMNQCHKRKLLLATQAKLDSFAGEVEERLDCVDHALLDVNFDNESQSYLVNVDGKSVEETFIWEGYYLKNPRGGFFVIELNGSNMIRARDYYSLDMKYQSTLASRLRTWPKHRRLFMLYLEQDGTSVSEELAEVMQKTGIELEGSGVYLADPAGAGPRHPFMPINDMPFRIGLQGCLKSLSFR